MRFLTAEQMAAALEGAPPPPALALPPALVRGTHDVYVFDPRPVPDFNPYVGKRLRAALKELGVEPSFRWRVRVSMWRSRLAAGASAASASSLGRWCRERGLVAVARRQEEGGRLRRWLREHVDLVAGGIGVAWGAFILSKSWR